MAKNPIEQRRRRYFRLSTQIAQMDNHRLHRLFEENEPQQGWGRNHTLEIAGDRVFVKRVPVTDLEYDNPFSTRNLYGLPTYYNYGVGSAGFGISRELVTHIKTTNWVLNGEIEGFPLLYHYRVVPATGERTGMDTERHQGYVNYWGGSETIGRYMLDRAAAGHEIVLFLEHVPHVLHPWLKENPGKVDPILNDLRATIDFLRKRGVIHFDAHFHNILTDGERAYLTDFGLVLDRSFDLSPEELAFFQAHTHYDYGEILSCLTYVLYNTYEDLPESDRRRIADRYGLDETAQGPMSATILLDNIEAIHADGVLTLDKRFVACIVRYRSVIALMREFYTDLRGNSKKDTPFPHAALKRLLKETGFV